MDFLSLAKERCSVRACLGKPVEQEKIDKILEAARVAPTACNFQPQVIYVLKSKDAMAKAMKATSHINGAPMAFLICYNTSDAWKNPLERGYSSGESDASIVCTHMMLEAWDIGIGTLWIRGFDANKVAEVFELPSNIKPVCMLAAGYAKEDAILSSPAHSKNKEISEFVKEI